MTDTYDTSSFFIKTTTVGYSGHGKTCMFTTFAMGHCPTPEEYLPRVFQSAYCYSGHTSSGQPIEMGLWDTVGDEEYARLRPMSYPDTDIIILCFSVESETRQQFQTLKSYWCEEIKQYCPNIPIILVATKIDLRDDDPNAITSAEGRKMAENIHAMYYREISSLRHEGITELFQLVVDIGCQRVKQKLKM